MKPNGMRAAAVAIAALLAAAPAGGAEASCTSLWTGSSASNSCWDGTVSTPSQGKCSVEATCEAVRNALDDSRSAPEGCTFLGTRGTATNIFHRYGCDTSLDYAESTTESINNCDGTLTLGSC